MIEKPYRVIDTSPVSDGGFGKQLKANTDNTSEIAVGNTIRREIAFRKRT